TASSPTTPRRSSAGCAARRSSICGTIGDGSINVQARPPRWEIPCSEPSNRTRCHPERSEGSASVSRATERLRFDKRAWFGGGTIVFLVLLAVAAPFFARHDPFGIDLINSLQPPSANHWFGTDIQGRDVWARLVYGARVSLSVGIISQGIALSLGIV